MQAMASRDLSPCSSPSQVGILGPGIFTFQGLSFLICQMQPIREAFGICEVMTGA